MHANTMMVKVAMCLLFSMRMTSQSGAEGANLLRQRKTRREVDAASPVVAVAAATVHTQRDQTAREWGRAATVEEEENSEMDHYFRRTVQSSLNQKKYNCRCRLLFISVEKYAKVYYWTI